ncbi:hypothetical protein GOV11_01780 [Candidatus Woesearchaeota archaeon]|nr:hypothetical protein [Candidatus Woesearchaeota archaeon]
MRLFIPKGSESISGVLAAMKDIRLNEAGRSFHGLPSKQGEVALVDEPLADEYQSGVVVISPKILPISGELGTVFLGTHELSLDALPRLKEARTMRELMLEGLSDTLDSTMARARGWEHFHLVVDMDAVEKIGGFTPRELIHVVQRLRMVKNLSSAELVVGDNPKYYRLAAKILVELL